MFNASDKYFAGFHGAHFSIKKREYLETETRSHIIEYGPQKTWARDRKEDIELHPPFRRLIREALMGRTRQCPTTQTEVITCSAGGLPADNKAWRRHLVVGLVITSAVLAQGCGGTAQSENLNGKAAPPVGTPYKSTDPEARGLVYNSGQAAPGYILFSPLLSDTTYLVDVDGLVVHQWKSDFAPGAGLYLLDNGNLLRSARDPEVTSFRSGGVGGLIEEFTWDGEPVWKWGVASEQQVFHHDIEQLPNGNVLALGWEVRDADEARKAGRREDLLPEQGIWPDFIMEIEKLPPDGGNVIWEWHVWDHLIQNADDKATAFGDPAHSPHLVDINGDGEPSMVDDEELEQLKAIGYVPEDATKEDLDSDFLHINAIDYNPHLDQIALSVPQLGEIWIIDHSTNPSESVGSTGGRAGRGGDLLYRWGNPRVYGHGTKADQQLFYQHDVRWIPDTMPGAGNLTIFNNGGGRPDGDWSSVIEITPPLTDDGRYKIGADGSFASATPAWTYSAEASESFFAPFISGANRIANGHTMVCSGPDGRFFEVTRDGKIVWEYLNPFSGGVRNSDGSMPQPGLESRPFAVFRATKISADHPALIGRALIPLDPQPKIWPKQDKGDL